MPKVTTSFSILNKTLVYCKSQMKWLFVYYHLLHKWGWQIDLRQRQLILLPLVGCLACNNVQMAIWDYQIMMQQIQEAKMHDGSNKWHGCIHYHGMVALLHRHHFQALPTLAPLHYSTWHRDHGQGLVQPKDIRVMSHHSKHMIAIKETMVDLECSPLSNSQDKGLYLQAHL